MLDPTIFSIAGSALKIASSIRLHAVLNNLKLHPEDRTSCAQACGNPMEAKAWQASTLH